MDTTLREDAIIDMAKAILNDERISERAEVYLTLAEIEVLNRVFPYTTDYEYVDVPERYDAITARVVAYLVTREGSEGETMHSENGTQREYQSAGVPASYFAGIVPFVGVPS